MQRVFIFIILSSVTLPRLYGQEYLSGPQSDTLAAGEYFVVDDIWVQNDSLWYLQPGVTLRFYEGVSCRNYGALYARGVEGDSIRFEAFDEGHPWAGLKFYTSNYRCYLEHCVITGSNETAITIEALSAVTITHTRISNNEGQEDRAAGIYHASASQLELDYLTFSGNYGDGIFVEYSNTYINHSTFKGNTGHAITGYHNIFYIDNTEISYNQDSGVYTIGAFCFVDSCDFLYNTAEYGGAFYCLGSSSYFFRSLFLGNEAENNGGCVYGAGSSGTTFINCVLASNSAHDSGSVYHANRATFANSIAYRQ